MVDYQKAANRGISAFVAAFGTAALLLFGGAAQAQQFIYGNSFGSGLNKFDAATGVTVKSCPQSKGNGRGIVVVGSVVYFTVANSGNVYKTNFTTCSDDGIAFAVAGSSGLSTIAYDGTNFWIGDYTGTNKAYYVSPAGTLLKTITLANCTGFCDGLEFFNGKLISNRTDGPLQPTGFYDIYDTNGALLTPAFITTTFSATGIAFDGTNFFVSDINNQKLDVYSGTTGAFIKTITLSGMLGAGIEDLSADYAIVLGPSGPIFVPTLSEWTLLVLSLMLAAIGLMAAYRMRRR